MTGYARSQLAGGSGNCAGTACVPAKGRVRARRPSGGDTPTRRWRRCATAAPRFGVSSSSRSPSASGVQVSVFRLASPVPAWPVGLHARASACGVPRASWLVLAAGGWLRLRTPACHENRREDVRVAVVACHSEHVLLLELRRHWWANRSLGSANARSRTIGQRAPPRSGRRS
jgi:hypothetical protein